MVRISTLVLLLIAAAAAGMVLIAPSLGLVYAVSVLPVPLFILLSRNRPPFIMTPVFIAATAFFVFYFVRPLILSGEPRVFVYWKLFITPSPDLMADALMLQGIYAFAFLTGLYAVMNVNAAHLSRPVSAFRHSTIAQLGPSFLFLLGALSLVWLGLVFIGNVGTKGTADTRLELLGLILPVSLIVPAAIAYLSARRLQKMGATERLATYLLVATNILIVILAGSKAGIFLLALYLLIYRMLLDRDFRTPIGRLMILGAAGTVLLGVSVFAANAIRISNATDISVDQYAGFVLSNADVLYILAEQITARFIGHDGLIAVLLVDPPAFAEVGRWDNILLKALGRLLPGIEFGGYSVGHAVGIFFEGRDPTDAHAGALGLVGMLHYMHGPYFGPVMACLIGVFFGLLFRLVDVTVSRGAPERVLAFLALSHMMAVWISSGNFDRLTQNLVILFAHMVFYFLLIRMFTQMTGRGALRRTTY